MKSLSYSFIIPHHNSPELLNRCLDSIPQRDDIEIIVVDDNSDNDKKPVISRKGVVLILIDEKQSKGAGHARNVGLGISSGKWILFADADDFYTDSINFFLDKYKVSHYDAVYFNVNYIDIRIKVKNRIINSSYSDAINTAENDYYAKDFVMFNNTMPWNKLVRKDFLLENNVMFEEVEQGNDIFFSYQVASYAQNVCFEKSILYNYFFQPNTITNSKWSVDKCMCLLENTFKSNEFKKYIGHKEWTLSPYVKLLKLLIKNYNISISLLICFIRNYMNIQDRKMFYVTAIKGDKVQKYI